MSRRRQRPDAAPVALPRLTVVPDGNGFILALDGEPMAGGAVPRAELEARRAAGWVTDPQRVAMATVTTDRIGVVRRVGVDRYLDLAQPADLELREGAVPGRSLRRGRRRCCGHASEGREQCHGRLTTLKWRRTDGSEIECPDRFDISSLFAEIEHRVSLPGRLLRASVDPRRSVPVTAPEQGRRI
jgi:hypothetical protein